MTTLFGKEEQTRASVSNQPDSSEGQEEKAEKMSDLELAYMDQGYHEMEFTSGNESELKLRREYCKKNPGHSEFIPVRKFTIAHLPEYWRDSLVFDFITTMISLTVRLAVKYTSNDRTLNYPLYNRRGQYGVTAYGSGRVFYMHRKFTKKDCHRCPCKTCQEFPHLAKTQWGQFAVDTAKHVVFDSSEARHTRCDLFFDSDGDMHDCPSLEGVRVTSSNTIRDDCLMTCITHDEDVSNKLEEMVDYYKKLRKRVKEKYQKSEHADQEDTAVVISHPHGLCKFVTVGEVTHKPDYALAKWKYSAETCTGSSGGTVCILGDWDEEGRDTGPWHATHSGCRQKGQNESAGW